MTTQRLDEYQMLEKEYETEDIKTQLNSQKNLGGSDLRGNRFRNEAESENVIFDYDFLKLFYADPDERGKIVNGMNDENYKEYGMMRREYRKTEYSRVTITHRPGIPPTIPFATHTIVYAGGGQIQRGGKRIQTAKTIVGTALMLVKSKGTRLAHSVNSMSHISVVTRARDAICPRSGVQRAHFTCRSCCG